MIRVGYFMAAGQDVIAEIRKEFDPNWELVTAAGDSGLDAVITARMNRQAIMAASRLKLIQLPGVGSDMVDVDAAAERGIPVCEGSAGSAEEVAEFTLLLMLAVSRRLVEIANSTRSGEWRTWAWRTRSVSLHGKRLGVVGMGRIGREVARRAAAFGMRVTPGPIGELLASSDYLSLHCPLTAETRHMLDRGRIARMKPGAILINTARGELVDEAALIDALRSGHLGGAGLDVLEREPPAEANPLLAMEQVICTPHLATGTIDSLRSKAAFYAANIRRVLRGEEPLGRLGPPQ
jgi:phosphoglycerate dehydrogenase-like enzyme